MALTKVTYSMIESAPINVLDYGVTGDGTTDDTTAIAAAIAAGNGGVVYFPAGTYKITSPQVFSSQVNTKIVGERFQSIIAVNSDISAWQFDDTCNKITVIGMTFAGQSVGTLSRWGLDILANNSYVSECYFYNFNQGLKFRNNGVEITGCIAENNLFENIIGTVSGNGYAIYNTTTHAKIIGNTFNTIGRHCVYLSGDNVNSSQYCVVSNNTINDCTKEAISIYATSTEQPCSYNTISNNTIKNASQIGIGLAQQSLDNVVSSNTIVGKTDGSMTHGIYVNGSTTANTYPKRNIISNNYIENAQTIGVGGQNAFSTVISGNIVNSGSLGTPTTYGFNISESGSPTSIPEGNVIIGNRAIACTYESVSNVASNGNLVSLVQTTNANKYIVFPDGSTTPTVGIYYTGAGKNFKVSNTAPTTITNFLNAEDGQQITLMFTNGNTTISNANCYLAGGAASFVGTANDTLTLIYRSDAAQWFEVCRSVN